MSICFGCGSKFSFFKKEYVCESCGRIHCSKCLKNELLPPSSKVKKEVCKRCYDSHRNVKDKCSPGKSSAEKDRLKISACEAPAQSTQVRNAKASPAVPHTFEKTKGNDLDAEIKQRLEDLKKKENPGNVADLSENSVNDRFLSLTGREPISATRSNILAPQRKLTEQEEIAQLMESAFAEAKLDQTDSELEIGSGSAIDAIEDRLLKLKGIDPSSVKKSDLRTEDDSSDEEGATSKIIRKALAEARIDKNVNEDGYGQLIEQKLDTQCTGLPIVPTSSPGIAKRLPTNQEEDWELPWCCICNENAVLRCHGCDDDLYCKRCFREGHSRTYSDYHETSPFSSKRNAPFPSY